MTNKEEVYQLVRLQGPLIPSQITSQLKSDTIFIGAYLSELCSNNRVAVTTVKRGGSPFYYLKEQQEKLQLLRDDLNEKDQRTFDLLKKELLLDDREVPPLVRVSLRNVKDFAVPVEVSINNEQRLFWKWYLMSNEDASIFLKNKFVDQKEPEKIPEASISAKKIDDVLEEKKLAENTNSLEYKPLEIKPPIKPTKKLEQKKIVQDTFIHTDQPTSIHTNLPSEILLKLTADSENDLFLKDVLKFFNNNNIYITEYTIHKKNRDVEFIITIPTVVGGVQYYCRARSKKRSNESDLAVAYVVGESKKLPVLFLTDGEVTKKALENVEKLFKNLKIKHLGST